MTVIAAVMARSYTAEMFDDLNLPPHERLWDRSGVTTLSFDVELDAETVQAIRDRMMSRDDADQAQRAHLRDLLAAAEATELDPVGQLAVAAMRYWLGETP